MSLKQKHKSVFTIIINVKWASIVLILIFNSKQISENKNIIHVFQVICDYVSTLLPNLEAIVEVMVVVSPNKYDKH